MRQGVGPDYEADDWRGVRDVLREVQGDEIEAVTPGQARDALGPGCDRFLAALEARESATNHAGPVARPPAFARPVPAPTGAAGDQANLRMRSGTQT